MDSILDDINLSLLPYKGLSSFSDINLSSTTTICHRRQIISHCTTKASSRI
ncbi:MAG: hypothetical protein KME32_11800 [Mojavia pulchra JT2-VF2]|uniref:Uncharacterized protein n=1 Tax=Mojavia pulchra JT2-VF2 TaxID=287848 RepID=A0A951UH69_9NOST|nr:hypothetical protein [Mojavia pulchra JT2-VF2]